MNNICKKYSNLEVELNRNGINKDLLAKEIGISTKAFLNKLSGKDDFTYNEAIKIRSLVNSNVSLQELFEKPSDRINKLKSEINKIIISSRATNKEIEDILKEALKEIINTSK